MAEVAKKSKNSVHQARLGVLYREKLIGELSKELGAKNSHTLPRLRKIVVSVGLGRAKDDKKVIAAASNTLAKITGQQPIATYAKQSIASFKLREGSQIGLKVTLRGDRMYEFADRLINIVLPRLRDFHGVSSASFDAQGNFHLGLTDQSVFAELSFEETSTVHGLQVSFVIDSPDTAGSKLLLEKLGMPFDKQAKDSAKEEKNG